MKPAFAAEAEDGSDVGAPLGSIQHRKEVLENPHFCRPEMDMSVSRASFFEMFARGRLVPTLSPALRALLVAAFRRLPTRAATPLLSYADEAVLVLLAMVQWQRLSDCDATFGEAFYGLIRRSVAADRKRLTRWQRLTSLIIVVLVPYLRERADEWHQVASVQRLQGEHRGLLGGIETDEGDETDGTHASSASWMHRLRDSLLVPLYPYLRGAYDGAHAAYMLAYMAGASNYYTPVLHLMRVQVHRAGRDELEAQQQRARALVIRGMLDTARPGIWPALRRVGIALRFFLSISSTNVVLPLGVFLYRVIEWWQHTDMTLPDGTSEATVVPPPPRPRPLPPVERRAALGDIGTCPLCRAALTNAAMTPTGFVFCFACIRAHVEANRACPVTLAPVATDRIRKLYEAT